MKRTALLLYLYRFLIAIAYSVVGTLMLLVGSGWALVPLTIAFAIIGPTSGVTVTFAPLKVRILLAIILVGIAFVLLGI